MTRWASPKMISLMFTICALFTFITVEAYLAKTGSVLIVFFPAVVAVVFGWYAVYLIKKKIWLKKYWKEKKKDRK